jgi:hypothetical protein
MNPGSPSLAALFRDYGERWEIEKITRGSEWVAVLRGSDYVRIVAAHDLGALRFRIVRAEQEEKELDQRVQMPSATKLDG